MKNPTPPAWLVSLLANFSGGERFAPSLAVHDAAHSVLKRDIRPREAVKPTVTEL